MKFKWKKIKENGLTETEIKKINEALTESPITWTGTTEIYKAVTENLIEMIAIIEYPPDNEQEIKASIVYDLINKTVIDNIRDSVNKDLSELINRYIEKMYQKKTNYEKENIEIQYKSTDELQKDNYIRSNYFDDTE